MSNNIFLASDYHDAIRHIKAYEYYHENALQHMSLHEYDKAAAYHQNMIQSLNELQRLKNKKQMADQVLNHIKSEQQMQYVIKQFRG